MLTVSVSRSRSGTLQSVAVPFPYYTWLEVSGKNMTEAIAPLISSPQRCPSARRPPGHIYLIPWLRGVGRVLQREAIIFPSLFSLCGNESLNSDHSQVSGRWIKLDLLWGQYLQMPLEISLQGGLPALVPWFIYATDYLYGYSRILP